MTESAFALSTSQRVAGFNSLFLRLSLFYLHSTWKRNRRDIKDETMGRNNSRRNKNFHGEILLQNSSSVTQSLTVFITKVINLSFVGLDHILISTS